jgi:TM2 domain-containing membrane protein YozV
MRQFNFQEPVQQVRYCSDCGKQINPRAEICPHCGVRQYAPRRHRRSHVEDEVSPKSRLAALLLCIFVGWLGVHRFYVGKIGTGILQLITAGGLGVWMLVDLILIVVGSFKDNDGLPLEAWLD